MGQDNDSAFGEIIKRQRLLLGMTLSELASRSGVSASHLGRIERGERFPSARILRRIAPYLNLEERELFTLAGYLTTPSAAIAEPGVTYAGGRLDPQVAMLLAQEPVEIQRAVISILTILKSIAKGLSSKNDR